MSSPLASTIRNNIGSFFCKLGTENVLYQNPSLRILFFSLGAGLVLKSALCWTKCLLSLFRPRFNLGARYGNGTWAVVTGASDGIGKAFAFELASRGFNIVLVSRTQEKLELVAKALQYKYPAIQTRVIVADFVNAAEENFAENIFEQVKDLDISILINNAGGFIKKPYLDISTKEIRDLIVLNSLSHALVSRVFLPKMSARDKKSAIINVSSIAGGFAQPHRQIYSASKGFLDYLSRGLSSEYPNIDILSVKPAYVITGMTSFRQPDTGAITPEQLVEASLNSLGRTTHTYGHWKHRVRGWFILGMPQWLRNIYIKNILMKQTNSPSQAASSS